MVLMARVEPLEKDIDGIDEASDGIGVNVEAVGGVDDVVTADVGTVGLPAAWIALWTEELLRLVTGIVTLEDAPNILKKQANKQDS